MSGDSTQDEVISQRGARTMVAEALWDEVLAARRARDDVREERNQERERASRAEAEIERLTGLVTEAGVLIATTQAGHVRAEGLVERAVKVAEDFQSEVRRLLISVAQIRKLTELPDNATGADALHRLLQIREICEGRTP